MTQARLETTVGLFVLAGLAAVAWLALKIGGGSFMGADTYHVRARFTNATGVNPGSSVMISGVRVGRVETVQLNTEDFSAVVDMSVRSDIQLSSDSIVSVKTSGLIGDKFLDVKPGVEDEIVKPGGMLTETESTVDIESLISRFAFGDVKNKDQDKETP